MPWNVTARNIDLTLEKRDAYGGDVSFSGGTLAIKDFEPMTLEMEAAYDQDGAHVTLTHIDLLADGFRSVLTGEVDLLNWPEQTYRIHGIGHRPGDDERDFSLRMTRLP